LLDRILRYHLLISKYIFIISKSTVQRPVRIILLIFNKLSYLKIILRIMKKKTSVLYTATIATILTLVTLALEVPAPVMAGSASGGGGGSGGVAGNGGIGGVGGIAVFGFADGGNADGGHGGDANGGYAQCQTGCMDYHIPKS
jgi:uncharacterized membrane protein YgcG